MPGSNEGTDYAVVPSHDFDISNDFFYPLCYAVYCDGNVIGYTTKKQKVLVGIPAGTHTVSVSSMFNGGNESAHLSQTVTVTGQATGIGSVEADSRSTRTVVMTADGRMVRSLPGTVSAACAVSGLPSGLYIVNGRKVVK